MSNNNLAGFPACGPRVETNITYHPKEIVFDPVSELPTSEPESPQVEMTVADGDLPTFSPYPIPFYASHAMADRYLVLTVASFYNSGAASASISGKYNSAGTTYLPLTGGTIGAGKYKTVTFTNNLTSWDVGSTFKYKFYANATGVQLLRVFVVIIPRKIGGGMPTAILHNVEIQTAKTSLIGAASCTNTHNYAAALINIQYRTPNLGGAVSMSGLNQTSGLNIIGAMAMPGTENLTTLFLCGAQTMAELGGTNTSWSGDYATETLYHFQPWYPTRVAYTPIL